MPNEEVVIENAENSIRNGPKIKYIMWTSMTTPRTLKGRKLGHYRKRRIGLPLGLMFCALFSCMRAEGSKDIYEPVWKCLAFDNIDLAEKMALSWPSKTIHDLALAKMLAAFTAYKDCQPDEIWLHFNELDMLLDDYFIRKKITLQEDFQIDQ